MVMVFDMASSRGGSMKIAGFLALVFSLTLGTWFVGELVKTQHARQVNAAAMQHEVNRELAGGTAADEPFARDKALHDTERFDEAMMVVAGCLFAGAAILFARRRPTAQPA